MENAYDQDDDLILSLTRQVEESSLPPETVNKITMFLTRTIIAAKCGIPPAEEKVAESAHKRPAPPVPEGSAAAQKSRKRARVAVKPEADPLPNHILMQIDGKHTDVPCARVKSVSFKTCLRRNMTKDPSMMSLNASTPTPRDVFVKWCLYLRDDPSVRYSQRYFNLKTLIVPSRSYSCATLEEFFAFVHQRGLWDKLADEKSCIPSHFPTGSLHQVSSDDNATDMQLAGTLLFAMLRKYFASDEDTQALVKKMFNT